ncbi:sulfotransferase [Salinisphaera sp.]|uniref:sulfotransferase n=1 Tax=Salinisphaera sp. TaxID=1914330 RepID=UPI002D776FDF|nr:sulfotransferase [Salinisphaera sp.]HET7314308.1 sulfotransferase [Salinisphaera sp.]
MSDETPDATPRSTPAEAAVASFAVPTWMHRVAGWQERHPRGAIRLGNFDTKIAADAIENVTIDAPIYIAGLARSGTTILLELLAEHPEVATHKYRDFPPVFTPWLWDRWLARVPEKDETAAERAHGDGIAVTSHSPEAFEEVLWMAFFEHSHDPAHSNVLTRETTNPEFEAFYAEHIRKILAIRGGARYAAKGNYNLMRLGYLQKLFADARFVLPIRDPIWHIASLMKQQALFEAGEKAHPRASDHLRRVGHFEFGLQRRPINTGDSEAVARIEKLWNNGQEVEGWARYWALVYGALADQIDADETLEKATQIVRYEPLCTDSPRVLADFYRHCGLTVDAATLDAAGRRLHLPDYYRPAFETDEIETIRRLAGPVAERFGYDPARLGGHDPVRM